MKARRAGLLGLVASLFLLCGTPTSPLARTTLTSQLDDRTFWTLVTDFSEPSGYFRSDNLVSNETEFQHVIPTLEVAQRPASAYIGVGPDQNFTYLVALQPRIAFIVDIRRQNLLLQLMYKALIEMAPTRAEFLTRLFSRERASAAKDSDTAESLFEAIDKSPADQRLYEKNLQEIEHRLTGRHRFRLGRDDLNRIAYVYRSFYEAGPELRYSFGSGPGWLPFPSYRDLMIERDGSGRNRSYLASEENYRALRNLEVNNLIVPLVGDFAGPKALRSVASFLRSHSATVTAFYTSNVEQYLFNPRDDWQRFYANVAAMPLEDHSTFIRAVFNNAMLRGFMVTPAPYPLPPPPMSAPRSVTLLNPISELLNAFESGRLRTYRDVVELSANGLK